ncbi:MAG: hypothetical protein Q9160_007914 [Pyrenula sp. 1 TL-2023]
MKSSSSPTSTDLSTTKLQKALIDAVAILNGAHNNEPLTVNNVRRKAESLLNLNEGFYATDVDWKQESKRIIKAEVDSADKASAVNSEDGPSRPELKPLKGDDNTVGRDSGSKKRPSPEGESSNAPSKKRKKNAADSGSSSRLSSPPASSSESEAVEKTVVKKQRGRPANQTAKLLSRVPDRDKTSTKSKTGEAPKSANSIHTDSQSELSSVPEDESPLVETHAPPAQAASSEDELSDVLDEPPKPKKRRQNTKESTSKGSKKFPKAKAGSEPTPDEAEIKRLQGWLVKCGIRKLWGKELKPFETSKAKIRHLRQMLEDVGMTGRFSMEKARDIRERRELAADLAEVQDRTQRWGKDNSSDADSGEKPKRKLVRGSRNFDFLSDNDGEESD